MLVVPDQAYEAYKAHDVWGLSWIETPTGIEGIHNSQFSIHNEGTTYNLAGQRMNKTQKGINIVGGKIILK